MDDPSTCTCALYHFFIEQRQKNAACNADYFFWPDFSQLSWIRVYFLSLNKIKYLHLLADVNPRFGDIFCDYKINYAHVSQEKNK